MRPKHLLALTPGDPDGIGPEIVWKSIQSGFAKKHGARILCVGAREPFERLGAPLEILNPDKLRVALSGIVPSDRKIYLLEAPDQAPAPGLLLPGYQSGWSIEKATRLVLAGAASALVTGPIHKERLQKGGYPYSGHTDFLADLCGSRAVTMMLANSLLRISLVTVHIGLKDVPARLTRAEVRRAIQHTVEHLRSWWGIRCPRVAVAALNPHAGEGGLFGDEEKRIIEPVIRAYRKGARGKVILEGPLPADTLFTNHRAGGGTGRYDAVVCMYHDQGLIPVKLLDFPRTVNLSLGLPMVRTSVDHGTAFDIAGTGKANPSSLQSAIEFALEIVRKRRPALK